MGLTPFQSSVYQGRRQRPAKATVAAKVANEACRHCGRPSEVGHPAGVVPGQWKCGGCGEWQDK